MPHDFMFYSEVAKAPEKAYEKRKTWVSPGQVAVFTDESVSLATTRQPVERGEAIEKEKKAIVFKPKRVVLGGQLSNTPIWSMSSSGSLMLSSCGEMA